MARVHVRRLGVGKERERGHYADSGRHMRVREGGGGGYEDRQLVTKGERAEKDMEADK